MKIFLTYEEQQLLKFVLKGKFKVFSSRCIGVMFMAGKSPRKPEGNGKF